MFLHAGPAPAVAVLPTARDVTLYTLADLEAAKPFINAAYEGRATTAP